MRNILEWLSKKFGWLQETFSWEFLEKIGGAFLKIPKSEESIEIIASGASRRWKRACGVMSELTWCEALLHRNHLDKSPTDPLGQIWALKKCIHQEMFLICRPRIWCVSDDSELFPGSFGLTNGAKHSFAANRNLEFGDTYGDFESLWRNRTRTSKIINNLEIWASSIFS